MYIGLVDEYNVVIKLLLEIEDEDSIVIRSPSTRLIIRIIFSLYSNLMQQCSPNAEL